MYNPEDIKGYPTFGTELKNKPQIPITFPSTTLMCGKVTQLF